MPTTNYSLPTLSSTDTMDLVTQYNNLAEAVDTALKTIADSIPSEVSMRTITTWDDLKTYGAYAPQNAQE